MLLLRLNFILLLAFLISCNSSEEIFIENCELLTIPLHEGLRIENPNFIFILTDDQRYDAMGFLQDSMSRYPWLKTPYIDELAKNGSVFLNSFVPISLCSPSRASILTGRYPNSHGIISNYKEFHGRNYANILTLNGYETIYFGKWHMNMQRGLRPGFKKSYSYIGQGAYFDCEFEIDGKIESTQGWVDDVSTDYLIEELNKSRNSPFFFTIGYKTSHGPWSNSPDVTKGYYSSVFPESVPSLEKPAKYLGYNSTYNYETDYWPEYQWKDRKYFENITAMDLNIGKIANELKKLGLEDNTVIIFTSDNGFYHGEHGLRDKRTAYEESIRVPLIIKYGNKKTKDEIHNMVVNVDLAPTILDAAGLLCNRMGFEGYSLLPSLFGLNFPERESFIFQYYEESIGPPFSLEAIRSNEFKYVKYTDHPEWDEIFDIKNDPYEIDNLIESDSLRLLLEEMLEMEKIRINL